jgi:acyl carrier protein
MNEREIAGRIEEFLRTTFSIKADDPGFGPGTDLFEADYVDSVGLAELLAFIEEEFQVAVPDEELLSEDFATIEGMARTVARLAGA